MTDKTEPDVPDLRALLAEASRPAASVTVPLNQALWAQIEQADLELKQLAEILPARKRMGAESPLTVKAREIQALREHAEASSITLHFEAPTRDAVDAVRSAMGGRDDPDEYDLRLTAASCVKVTDAKGRALPKVRPTDQTRPPEVITWEDLRQLRDDIGFPLYEASIKDASDKVYRRDWSIPFSQAASLILGTET